MNPQFVVKEFDSFLAARNCRFEGVCIGGTALVLMGIIQRATQDCDILVPHIPTEIRELAREFARMLTDSGTPLISGWLNNGPASLTLDLPAGWEDRVVRLCDGEALVLTSLGRKDLLRSKLFALCDRAVDRSDCLMMAPTKEELLEVSPWLQERDANPDWPTHVTDTLSDIARELGYEL